MISQAFYGYGVPGNLAQPFWNPESPFRTLLDLVEDLQNPRSKPQTLTLNLIDPFKETPYALNLEPCAYGVHFYPALRLGAIRKTWAAP